jgi:hypothetical protein
MSPSVAQLTPETVDPVKVAKENIKAQEVKSDNVSIAFTFTSLCLLIPFYQGPSYPFYYPYFDVNEKFVPTEPFGMFYIYSIFPDLELNLAIRPCRSWYPCRP